MACELLKILLAIAISSEVLHLSPKEQTEEKASAHLNLQCPNKRPSPLAYQVSVAQHG